MPPPPAATAGPPGEPAPPRATGPTHRCSLGGILVSPSYSIPGDPSDFYLQGLTILGCNAIRCRHCGVFVRNEVDLERRETGQGYNDSDAKRIASEIYAAPDLTKSPHVQPLRGARFYVCQCSVWSEMSEQQLVDPDPILGSPPPWLCDGHPVVTLPHDFDGVVVHDPAELAALATRALHGELPPQAIPADLKGGTWLARLYARLADTPWQESVVAAAVLAALEDPGAAARGRALYVAWNRKHRACMERAVELYKTKPELFSAPDPVSLVRGDVTLGETFWRAVIPLVAEGGEARALARAEAVAPGRGSAALYAALAAADAGWVADHAERIARATPGRRDSLAQMIRVRFPRSVPSQPVVDRLQAAGGSRP